MADKNSTANQSIPAVAYLRKSTAGQRADGKERQEKSLSQQTAEVAKLTPANGGCYDIRRTYADPGKSGWKRGAARPDFTQMLSDCQQRRDVQAILVDDLDRFSRATVGEVWTDIQALKSAGVRFIHAANQGVYDLGNDGDIGTILKLTVEVWSANQFSAKLGRRVALARRNAAQQGKRCGGVPPFGMKSDGNGGLLPGDPNAVEIVQWIFDLFVNRQSSFNRIAKVLNSDGIPAPQGGGWHRATVKAILSQAAYAGRFEAGSQSAGRFYRVAADGGVIESNGQGRTKQEPAFVHKDVYQPIIDAKLFDSAQKRLGLICKSRKPRADGYALSGGILRCDHCGGPLIAAVKNGKTVHYRCMSNLEPQKKCGNYAVREDEILPAMMRLLDEEIDALLAESLAPKLPTPVAKPDRTGQIKALESRLKKYSERILDIDDKETRQQCDRTIQELRGQLAELKAEQAAPAVDDSETVRELADWWKTAEKTFVKAALPVDGTIAKTCYRDTAAYLKGWGDDSLNVEIDRRAINEALHSLGCEVRLRFRTEPRKLRNRYYLEKGRFRLGQRHGALERSVMSAKPRNPSLWGATPLA